MSNSWSYQDFSDSNVDDVLDAITATISVESAGQFGLVKVTASDQHDGDARGVVFTCNTPGEPPALPGPVVWQMQMQTTSSDYDSLYSFVTTLLNGFSGDNFYQAYYAYVNMTNREDGDATISVWYPQG